MDRFPSASHELSGGMLSCVGSGSISNPNSLWKASVLSSKDKFCRCFFPAGPNGSVDIRAALHRVSRVLVGRESVSDSSRLGRGFGLLRDPSRSLAHRAAFVHRTVANREVF